jgi:hypothetical protein
MKVYGVVICLLQNSVQGGCHDFQTMVAALVKYILQYRLSQGPVAKIVSVGKRNIIIFISIVFTHLSRSTCIKAIDLFAFILYHPNILIIIHL